MNTYIYCLIDPISNNVRYIGKSNNPEIRFKYHLYEKGNTHKINWINYLKEKNLKPVLEIIDCVNNKEWEFWEQHYICLYKSWNFKLVNGDNGGLGSTRLTKETRDKISKANKGYKFSKECIEKRTALRKGYKHSEETKKKIGKSNSLKLKGRKLSKEIIDKIIISRKQTRSIKGYVYNARFSTRKELICHNILTNEIIEIKGIIEASKLLNLKRTTINEAINKNRIVSKTYKFYYKCLA